MSEEYASATRVSYKAAAAIRKGQIVKASGALVTPCTVSGEAYLGVAEHGITAEDIAAGKQVSVIVAGIVDVESAAATAIMTELQTDANGRAIAKTSTNAIVGLGLETGIVVSGSSAGLVRCLVRGKLSP
jgi:hypothetical protein